MYGLVKVKHHLFLIQIIPFLKPQEIYDRNNVLQELQIYL